MPKDRSGKPYVNVNMQDWRTNSAIRKCSPDARGLWWEILSYQELGSPLGSLVLYDPSPSDLEKIALATRMIPEDAETLSSALKELTENNVPASFNRTKRGWETIR
jgi:hypothetical protein